MRTGANLSEDGIIHLARRIMTTSHDEMPLSEICNLFEHPRIRSEITRLLKTFCHMDGKNSQTHEAYQDQWNIAEGYIEEQGGSRAERALFYALDINNHLREGRVQTLFPSDRDTYGTWAEFWKRTKDKHAYLESLQACGLLDSSEDISTLARTGASRLRKTFSTVAPNGKSFATVVHSGLFTNTAEGDPEPLFNNAAQREREAEPPAKQAPKPNRGEILWAAVQELDGINGEETFRVQDPKGQYTFMHVTDTSGNVTELAVGEHPRATFVWKEPIRMESCHTLAEIDIHDLRREPCTQRVIWRGESKWTDEIFDLIYAKPEDLPQQVNTQIHWKDRPERAGQVLKGIQDLRERLGRPPTHADENEIINLASGEPTTLKRILNALQRGVISGLEGVTGLNALLSRAGQNDVPALTPREAGSAHLSLSPRPQV